MVRVLVMANDSLLADAIVSNLAQDATLDVLRLKHHNRSKVHQAILEDCLVVIIVEEGVPEEELITANDLFQTYGCFRVITISPKKHHLHICDSYQMPVAGMAQVINFAKGFNQENWSEVKR